MMLKLGIGLSIALTIVFFELNKFKKDITYFSIMVPAPHCSITIPLNESKAHLCVPVNDFSPCTIIEFGFGSVLFLNSA